MATKNLCSNAVEVYYNNSGKHILSCSPLLVESKEGWKLSVFPQWKEMFSHIDDVFHLLADPVKIIQENDRGTVNLIRHSDVLFVAKRSLIQERRRWAQFTSIYRKGEGSRTLRNMANMLSSGIFVPEPVLVLEKSTLGFVVASWSLYHYLEGVPCTCSQSHRAAQALKEIHQKGWVHRDVHVKNFLLYDERVYLIDCAKAKAWRSKYAKMYDVVRLNNCCPGSVKEYGISETDWVYRLAKFHNNTIKFWRKIKGKIRTFLGIAKKP